MNSIMSMGTHFSKSVLIKEISSALLIKDNDNYDLLQSFPLISYNVLFTNFENNSICRIFVKL